MKQNKYMIVIIGLLLLIIAIIIYKKVFKITESKNIDNSKTAIETLDEEKFKKEYENLNDAKKDDGTNKYIQISVNSSNKMKYATYNELEDLIKNKTGIIYFGFPECPWCRRTLPVFLDTISEYEINKILYFNALNIRDKKHLDENNNIVTDKEGTEEYYKIIDLLKDFLGEYEGLNDSTIKRLYFPTFVFVKNGKIIGIHIDAVKSYTSTNVDMTFEQKQELKGFFKNYLDQIYNKKEQCDENKASAC